jgi:hypothetical protein
MGKYLDFAYREDTYGKRSRDAIAVKITDLGYETNDVGDAVPNIEVTVGPMSWEPLNFECPVCEAPAKVQCVGLPSPAFHPTRIRAVKVAVMRSFMYFPANPDRLELEQQSHGNDPTADFLLSPDEQLSGAMLTFRSGLDPLGPVPPGSILYITVYVAEQFYDAGIGQNIWLPWDLRGKAYAVIPNNYGGTQAAIDAMPRGVMTGGQIYGEHVMNPQTLFMKTMGYVLDTVISDGELMVGPVVDLHPNMVLPLLRGFGMEYDEESLLADRTVAHRVKHVLARYNEISMMKGTELGLTRYVEAVTGLPSQVVGPVNLILDRADTCPDDPKLFVNTAGDVDLNVGVGGTAMAAGSRAAAAPLKWNGIPSIGCVDGYTGGVTLVRRPVSPFREDDTTVDPWYDAKSPEPATRWVHRFIYAGTMTYGPPLDSAYCPLVTPGSIYTFRFRFYPEPSPIIVKATLTFLDRNGVQMTGPGAQVILSSRISTFPNAWNDYAPPESALAPEGAKFLHWQISFGNATTFPAAGTGPDFTVRLGALQLATGKPRLYRDPRAMALILDTGPGVTAVGTVMDDVTATINDATATMNDGVITGGGSTDSFERVLIAKMKAVLPHYLPAGVGIEIFTPDDVEYAPYSQADRL